MSIYRRISNLFFRSKVDQDIEDELKSHLAMKIEDGIAQGMSPEEARRNAVLRFGNPTTTRERVMAADAALTLENIRMDVRHAFRRLSKSPGFAVTAILTFSLGI